MNELVVSVLEVRKILGKDAEEMSDSEIKEVIETLDLMAMDALQVSKEDLLRKRDAKRLAKLTYDIYRQNKTYKK